MNVFNKKSAERPQKRSADFLNEGILFRVVVVIDGSQHGFDFFAMIVHILAQAVQAGIPVPQLHIHHAQQHIGVLGQISHDAITSPVLGADAYYIRSSLFVQSPKSAGRTAKKIKKP